MYCHSCCYFERRFLLDDCARTERRMHRPRKWEKKTLRFEEFLVERGKQKRFSSNCSHALLASLQQRDNKTVMKTYSTLWQNHGKTFIRQSAWNEFQSRGKSVFLKIYPCTTIVAKSTKWLVNLKAALLPSQQCRVLPHIHQFQVVHPEVQMLIRNITDSNTEMGCRNPLSV